MTDAYELDYLADQFQHALDDNDNEKFNAAGYDTLSRHMSYSGFRVYDRHQSSASRSRFQDRTLVTVIFLTYSNILISFCLGYVTKYQTGLAPPTHCFGETKHRELLAMIG